MKWLIEWNTRDKKITAYRAVPSSDIYSDIRLEMDSAYVMVDADNEIEARDKGVAKIVRWHEDDMKKVASENERWKAEVKMKRERAERLARFGVIGE